jgi:deazaflavin-dependent oxidoreductase (nitroreductase family)
MGRSEVSARPPGRLLRLVFKAPVALYRLHLGWLLGNRFILLTHTGRKTGQARFTVIEVVAHDRSIPEVVVIAAWGERAQWVRNLKAAPATGVQLGRVRWSHPEHRFMEPAQAADVIAAYRSRHPFAAKVLARLLGWPQDTDAPAYERFVQTLCAVAFRRVSG